jgi:very-short-patch-repair endonuclease
MRGTQPWKVNRSRVLRSTATSAEDILWFHLRSRRLGGFKFVRQFPIENYFADFACRDARLIVEIDGGTHGTSAERSNDSKRTQALNALGYRVARFHNNDVYENLDGVLDHLLAVLTGQEL